MTWLLKLSPPRWRRRYGKECVALIACPYTTLKGWPGRTQAIFIGVLLMVLVSLVLGGAWINSQ